MALPKLNLRDLFWLVVVVALGLGWTADAAKRSNQLIQAQWDQNKAWEYVYKLQSDLQDAKDREARSKAK